MKTTKRIVVLLILTLISVVPVESGEKSAKKLSETLTANCLLKISADPAILPLEVTLLDALLHSTGVGGNAVRDVLGISPDEIQGTDLILLEQIHSTSVISPAKTTGRRTGESTAQYEARRRAEAAARARALADAKSRAWSDSSNFVNEESILIRLQVNLEQPIKPAAEELLDVVIFNLRSSLSKVFDDHRNRLNNHLKVADEEAARTANDFRDMQDKLRELSATRILDHDRIISDMTQLREEIERIEMDQLSDKVVIDAMANQIAEIEVKTKAQLKSDDITQELNKMLNLQAQNLLNVKRLVEAGQAGQINLAEAEAKLARARIELAQRREELSKAAGGNLIESLNRKLADSSLKTARDKEYLSTYKRKLAETEMLLKEADEYELLSLKTDIAKENLREVLEWRDKVSRQVRMLQQPALFVIGSE